MKSLHKVLDVLEVFLQKEEDNLRLNELTKISGLNKATCSRIVTDLLKRGYLIQPEKRGKYYLGNKFLTFNRIITHKRKLNQIALHHMNELGILINECVFLASYEDSKLIISEVVESRALLRTAPMIGTQLPLYATAMGKIILANMPGSDLELYLKNSNLVKRTINTITGKRDLRNHLAMVAKEDIAFDYEESFLGVCNIAAPIRNSTGKVIAALGVLGPAMRMTETRMKELIPEVKRFAWQISVDLGFSK